MRKLRMLAACECSGRVRDAFAARNWEAWSADLLPSETPAQRSYTAGENRYLSLPSARGFHYQGDVRDLFNPYHSLNKERYRTLPPGGSLWDLVIAFPPCTHLSLAGAVWWKQKRADGRQDEAAGFFMEMVNAPAPYVAVENPRGDMTRRYRPPDQYVQPWWFGDPLVKATGLWLKGLPKLTAVYTQDDYEHVSRVATGGGSWRTDQKHGRGPNNGHEDGAGRKNRQRERNRTLPGLARALAGQWGSYIEKEEQHD
jgi:hypothetical protein